MEPEDFEKARQALKDWLEEPGELEVHDDAPVSETDTGYWVQCWAFIEKERIDGK